MSALSPASKKALANLRAFAPPPTNYYRCPLSRRAAVLILLFADRRGDLRVVLTIRSAGLKNYAGQAALPGGKADALSETAFAIARREAFEEIGLPLSDNRLPPGYSVEHLTELPAHLAMTELGVRPCVAYLRGPAPSVRNRRPDASRDILPTLDAREVAAVFTAPFRNFLYMKDLDSGGKGERVEGEWYKGSWHSWHETAWRMHQFFVPVEKEGVVLAKGPVEYTAPRADAPDPLQQPRYRVFGMTARILVDCARVAFGQEPEFEHNSHFGDEEMIAGLMKIGRLAEIKKEGEVLTREVMTEAAKARM